MKAKKLSIFLFCLATGTVSTTALSDSSKPTCDERPELRDCVKVEDPDAQPPAASVYRKPKPVGPTAKPLPATGGTKTR